MHYFYCSALMNWLIELKLLRLFSTTYLHWVLQIILLQYLISIFIYIQSSCIIEVPAMGQCAGICICLLFIVSLYLKQSMLSKVIISLYLYCLLYILLFMSHYIICIYINSYNQKCFLNLVDNKLIKISLLILLCSLGLFFLSFDLILLLFSLFVLFFLFFLIYLFPLIFLRLII